MYRCRSAVSQPYMQIYGGIWDRQNVLWSGDAKVICSLEWHLSMGFKCFLLFGCDCVRFVRVVCKCTLVGDVRTVERSCEWNIYWWVAYDAVLSFSLESGPIYVARGSKTFMDFQSINKLYLTDKKYACENYSYRELMAQLVTEDWKIDCTLLEHCFF